MTARRVAVLGGTGFVGHHVLAALEQRVHACVPASRREGVDLRNPAQARAFFAALRPGIVVNRAAALEGVSSSGIAICREMQLVRSAEQRDWSVKPAELHDLGLDRQTLA